MAEFSVIKESEAPKRRSYPNAFRDRMALYEGYIAQAERAAAREAEAWDGWLIPPGLRFAEVRGLSAEAAEKLSAHRPSTVGQARRIPGITPAAMSLLLVALKKASTST